MNKIKTISAVMKFVLNVSIWLAPLSVVIYWVFFEFFIDLGFSEFVLFYDKLTITPFSKFLAIIASMMPVAIFLSIAYKLNQLFDNYAKGVLFSASNVVIYKKLGLVLVLAALGNTVYGAMLSTIVSFQGSRFLTIDFGANEIIYILIGSLIYYISDVMLEGYKNSNELEQTV